MSDAEVREELEVSEQVSAVLAVPGCQVGIEDMHVTALDVQRGVYGATGYRACEGQDSLLGRDNRERLVLAVIADGKAVAAALEMVRDYDSVIVYGYGGTSPAAEPEVLADSPSEWLAFAGRSLSATDDDIGGPSLFEPTADSGESFGVARGALGVPSTGTDAPTHEPLEVPEDPDGWEPEPTAACLKHLAERWTERQLTIISSLDGACGSASAHGEASTPIEVVETLTASECENGLRSEADEDMQSDDLGVLGSMFVSPVTQAHCGVPCTPGADLEPIRGPAYTTYVVTCRETCFTDQLEAGADCPESVAESVLYWCTGPIGTPCSLLPLGVAVPPVWQDFQIEQWGRDDSTIDYLCDQGYLRAADCDGSELDTEVLRAANITAAEFLYANFLADPDHYFQMTLGLTLMTPEERLELAFLDAYVRGTSLSIMTGFQSFRGLMLSVVGAQFGQEALIDYEYRDPSEWPESWAHGDMSATVLNAVVNQAMHDASSGDFLYEAALGEAPQIGFVAANFGVVLVQDAWNIARNTQPFAMGSQQAVFAYDDNTVIKAFGYRGTFPAEEGSAETMATILTRLRDEGLPVPETVHIPGTPMTAQARVSGTPFSKLSPTAQNYATTTAIPNFRDAAGPIVRGVNSNFHLDLHPRNIFFNTDGSIKWVVDPVVAPFARIGGG